MKTILKVLAKINLIAGIFFSFLAVGFFGFEFTEYGREHSISVGIMVFIVSIFFVIMLTVIMCAVSEILDKVETLEIVCCENTQTEPTKIAEDDENLWQCSSCGRINPQYTFTCTCGNRKKQS